MNLSCFLAQNAMTVENVKYIASERFLDDDGKPVMWEIKAVSNSLDEEFRKSSTKKVGGTPDFDHSLYIGKLAAEATVYPDLSDASLQDSYGVMGKDSLLKAMLTPGEYSSYLLKVQDISGFNINFSEKVKTAKN